MASVANTKTARTTSLAVVATDGELLMRFNRHRDQAAFAEVVERHGRLVWIVCKQALRHHQDVEDAFQATFLILAQRATTIRASDSAAAWLYRVAQRTAIAARRRRSRLREEELVAEPPQGEEALPLIHDQQMMHVLMEELQSLPQKYQTPLVMQYFEGQSRRAIAEQTDSTLAQIQGRLVRGKRMLRSRLMRRGVSLSLATGAVAAANTSASAAVSTSLVAATAASSSSLITSGTAGVVSAAAVELSKQGLNAMWYASVTKSVSVVAGVLVVAGALWAAQQGDGGLADVIAGESAANRVDLGAVAVDVDVTEEPTTVAIAAAEPSKAGDKSPADWTASNTSPAQRQFELERDHWLLKAKAYRMKAAQIRAAVENTGGPASGEIDAMLLEADANMAEAKVIELTREIAMKMATGDAAPVADSDAPGEVKIFSLLNSDASDVVLMLKEQFGTGSLKFAVDTRTNQIVASGPTSDLAVVEALLLRLDSADNQQQKRLAQRDENERKISQLKDLLAEISTVYGEAELERERLEQTLLQKELEQLHEVHMQIDSPLAAIKGENGLQIQGEPLEKLKVGVQKRIVETKARLEARREQIARVASGIEKAQRERVAIERKLEYLEKANLQLEFPQEVPADDPIGALLLKSQIQHLQNELASRNAQPSLPNTVAASIEDLKKVQGENAVLRAMVEKLTEELAGLTSNTGQPATPHKTTLAPGNTLRIEALNVSREAPISGWYAVETEGTVALGPKYGRVNIAGLSVLEAEKRIQRHLGEMFENPSVQVTMLGQAGTTGTDSFGEPPPTAATPEVVASRELFQAINALRQENAELKQQIEELRKAQPGGDK